MAATTIAAQSVTDDDGTGTTGTIWNATFQANFEASINALFSATGGLTLNQAAGDGAILTLESSDVAHGMTSLAATAAYGDVGKVDGATGGLLIRGFSEGTRGMNLLSAETTNDTTKSTAALGTVTSDSYKKSGTSVTTVDANGNLFVVRNGSTARFILDADGDSHQDVGTAWTNFDIFDDVQVMNAMAAALAPPTDPLRQQFGHLLEQFKGALIEHRIVTFNEDGHHFVNWSRFHMLHVGATRQLAARLDRVERAMADALAERHTAREKGWLARMRGAISWVR